MSGLNKMGREMEDGKGVCEGERGVKDVRVQSRLGTGTTES